MPSKMELPSVDQVSVVQLRIHCGLRHPFLRFRNKDEHEADHRLHNDRLDHVHREATDDVSRTEPEPNQSPDI